MYGGILRSLLRWTNTNEFWEDSCSNISYKSLFELCVMMQPRCLLHALIAANSHALTNAGVDLLPFILKIFIIHEHVLTL